MLASCDTCYGVYDERQECPEETRDDSKGVTKGLHGENYSVTTKLCSFIAIRNGNLNASNHPQTPAQYVLHPPSELK